MTDDDIADIQAESAAQQALTDKLLFSKTGKNKMKQTFKGMEALLGQLAQGNITRLREKKHKQQVLLTLGVVIVVVFAFILALIIW